MQPIQIREAERELVLQKDYLSLLMARKAANWDVDEIIEEVMQRLAQVAGGGREAIDSKILRLLNSRVKILRRLLNSRKGTFYREIKKCRRIISCLIAMIKRLLFNWLLSYIILAFHRDRCSPRYTSTTDEDSSASYRFQLANYGAAKGMLGLSFHS